MASFDLGNIQQCRVVPLFFDGSRDRVGLKRERRFSKTPKASVQEKEEGEGENLGFFSFDSLGLKP